MDQPRDLSSIIEQLKTILSSQHLLNQSVSNGTNNEGSTSSTQIRVLPKTIPPLPPHCLTLPNNTSSTPSTTPLETLTSHLQSHILPYLNGSSLSPNYYGFVTGGATPAALLADFLVSVYDQNLSVHQPSDSIATAVEVAALNQLVQLFDLPGPEWEIGGPSNGSGGGGSGTFTTGATASNVLGLALGREWVVREAGRRRRNGQSMDEDNCSVARQGLLRACRDAGVDEVQVLSSLPHSSIVKAAAAVGIGRANVVDIGTHHESGSGSSIGIDLDKLSRLAGSMTASRKAYILAVSTGEVNTGLFATDGQGTFDRVRAICDAAGIWIHVDGAFGLFARTLSSSPNPEPYSTLLRGVAGIEKADSITSDGHKLLNVPYDCGLFFTRHKTLHARVFSNGNPAYLAVAESDVPSPMNLGVENSRRFRALPVWATLIAYGRAGYVDMLERQVRLARRVVRWLCTDPLVRARVTVLPSGEKEKVDVDVGELVDRTYVIVLFCAVDEQVNRSLVRRINDSGRMYVTGTVWAGQPAARIAVSNWQVDVERDFALIKDVVATCLE